MGDGKGRRVVSLVGAVVFGIATFCAVPQTRLAAQEARRGGSPVRFIVLANGQVDTIDVPRMSRIAIGDAGVADVTAVTPTELLIKAKRLGSTNMILWDEDAKQHHLMVRVVDPRPELMSGELATLTQELGMSGVRVEPRGDKVFLVGEVATTDERKALDEVLAVFGDVVVDLTTVRTFLPPAEVPPLVELSVQALELNRTEMDQLGVQWSTTIGVTEAATSSSPLRTALTRFGDSITRSSFGATLNALLIDNKARILSEPKLVTASGKEASSFIGVEVPILSQTGFGASGEVSATIDFRETGVLLKMTPTVFSAEGEKKIKLQLNAEVSSIDDSSALNVPVGAQVVSVPGFKVRTTSTEVVTTSGETVVIAGLLELEDSDAVTRVPGVARIPFVGRLFRAPKIESKRTELVITVTPQLVGSTAVARRGSYGKGPMPQPLATGSQSGMLLAYAMDVQQQLEQAFSDPKMRVGLPSGATGVVKLKLHMLSDGTLRQAMISQSSGVPSMDSKAVEVAQAQAPYPRFPIALSKRDVWLEVPVVFSP